MLPLVRQLGGRQLLAAEAGRGKVPLGAALTLGRGTEEEGQLQVLRRVGADRGVEDARAEYSGAAGGRACIPRFIFLRT